MKKYSNLAKRILLRACFGNNNSQQSRQKIVGNWGGIQRWSDGVQTWGWYVSSGAYSVLKSSGALVLSSEQTLREYTHSIKADSGFIGAVDKQLMYEAKISTLPDFQKCVCLLFDEVRKI